MLNSILVEQFGGIHRQKKSGVLTVVGTGYRLRFCLENGDPVGLDFCTDKDLLLAQTLLDFHKIGPEVYQMAVESRRLGKGTVSELVRRQQVVSEDEISQVTRAMVEDTLVRCFGSVHQELVFDERDDASTFDFDNSAIRLRIGTEVLLNTVQTRVAEIDRVMLEIGGPDAVFALSENETGSVPLTELEKHVLNFIDGRKTVDDIAVAFRESTLNMSRLLYGMVSKGVIKRTSGGGGVSRLRSAIQPVAGDQTAQPTVSLQPLMDFVPHHADAPAPRNRLVMAMLVAALLLVSAVGWLVIDANRRSGALDSAEQALVDNLTAGRWAEAIAQVDQARADAGNDLAAIQRVESLHKRLEEAVVNETALITGLMEKQDYASARERLDRLPPDRQPAELRTQLSSSEQNLSSKSEALVTQVARMLDAGNAAQAMRLINGANRREGEAAADYLARWRLSSLERAGSATLPLSQRTALVNQIMATDPTPHQRDQIARIRNDFTRLQQRTAEQIQQLRKQAEQGAFAEVELEWERLRLGDQLRGTPLAGEANELKKLIDQAVSELRGLEEDGLKLIENSDDAKAMGSFANRVQQALGKWPQASNGESLRMTGQLLNELSGLASERNSNDEATTIDSWLQDRQPGPAITALVKRRSQRLRDVETAAGEALETARVFARQNNWEGNERLLKELLARPEWKRTAARITAQRDLDSIDTLRGQQQAWQEELRQAMLRGETDRCLAIAQKMGLRYLPLVIHSHPAGAEVLRDGVSIGTTPVILDIPAGERAALSVVVQKTGFDSVNASGATAEGGWFLPVRLQRSSTGHERLNLTLTARPTTIGGRLWVASRQGAVSLAPGARSERFAFENPGTGDIVGQPLYAAPYGTSDGVWYPTREGIAIRIGKAGIERLPIAGRTDHALAAYTSELIVGRRFIILAGLDGALHASDDRNPLASWHGSAGAAFVGAPFIHDDRVLAARNDGRIDVHLPDDGKLVVRHQLDGEILSTWQERDGLHCLTRTTHWVVAGNAAPQRSPLPQEARSAGREVFITPDNHAWILTGGSWRDVGRFEGKVSATPLAWAGHAVLPLGSHLKVLGAMGFGLSSASEFLAPELFGEQLAVVTLEGEVRFFAP
jgi:hypothetical protein